MNFHIYIYIYVLGIIIPTDCHIYIFCFSIYWEFHHPNWLSLTHIFQRSRAQPPTRHHHECSAYPASSTPSCWTLTDELTHPGNPSTAPNFRCSLVSKTRSMFSRILGMVISIHIIHLPISFGSIWSIRNIHYLFFFWSRPNSVLPNPGNHGWF